MNQSDLPFITATEDGVILSIHVQPRASKNQLCGIQGEALKIRLTSPPVDGAANKLCREFLADLFGVAKSYVEIISGETSRHKRVKIIGDSSRFNRIAESLNISR
ncbi:MAG: YggU family protein [Geobacter sp.]|nr:YggU family protein [Geobacter sp.]